LTLSAVSGTTTTEVDTISATANLTALAAGSYSATITVTGTAATNSPQTIPVSLTVSENQATSATLTWMANTEPDLAGYKIFSGTQSGVYGVPISIGKVPVTSSQILQKAQRTFSPSQPMIPRAMKAPRPQK
jgi:hypothetical protein